MPVSRASASATSATTSVLLNRRPRAPSVPVRPPSFRALVMSFRVAWSAGARPKSSVVAAETVSAKRSATTSISTGPARHRSSGMAPAIGPTTW